METTPLRRRLSGRGEKWPSLFLAAMVAAGNCVSGATIAGEYQRPRPPGSSPGRGQFVNETFEVSGNLKGLQTKTQLSMYEHLCSWDNLVLAYRKASRGKRGHANVAAFEHRLEDNLLDLRGDLLAQTYRPGPYTSFFIHEPKRRLISAAPFCDRVVHHALCNLIEPIFERSFIADSYANRAGKGTHRALARCQHFARRFPYVLQCDIEQFFPAIDHAILRTTLAHKLADPQVLWLIDRILASGAGVLTGHYDMRWFAGDDLLAALRPRGLPIGNLTSQFWANCYLNPFDHFVKRELGCTAYLRYVDDFLLFADDKRTLWEWRAAIVARLARFRLTIHPGAQARPVTEGIPFLGFTTFPNLRRLKRRKGIFFCRRFRALLAAYRAGAISRETVDASVRGWANHVRYANTVGVRKAVLARSPVGVHPRRGPSRDPAANLRSLTSSRTLTE